MSSDPRSDPSLLEALNRCYDDAHNERLRREPDLSTWSDEALDARLSVLDPRCSALAEESASIESHSQAVNRKRLASQREREEIKQIKRDRGITDVFQEDPLLRRILSFLPDSFRFTAAVSQRFHRMYLDVHDDSNKTSYKNATETVETAQLCLDEGGDAEILCRIAASNGRLPVLEYLRSQYDDLRAWNKVCTLAAGNGQLECLQWAREKGYRWDSYTCLAAAKNGHLECLKWARQNGCGWWLQNICEKAAQFGHLECLKCLRENGCHWNELTCIAAAEQGHLECLKWARKNGCRWTGSTCEYAAENGQLECLKWAIGNGCDCDIELCIERATDGGHHEVLEWLQSRNM